MGKTAETRRTEYAADKAYEGQIATNNANLEAVDRTNAANLQLAQQQNQWNIEQWNRENEYNSPANQMKLYKQAGLNPALAQGQFQPAASLESAPMANQQAGQIQNPESERSAILATAANQRAHDKLAAISELPRQISQIATNWSEMRKKMVETNLIPRMTDAQIKQLASSTALDNLNYDYLRNANPVRLIQLQKDVEQAAANIEYTHSKTSNTKASTQLLKDEQKIAAARAKILDYEVNDWNSMRQVQKDYYKSMAYSLWQDGKLDADEIAWRVRHGGLSRQQSMFNSGQKNDVQMFNTGQRNQMRITDKNNANAIRIAEIYSAGKFAGDLLNIVGKSVKPYGKGMKPRLYKADFDLFSSGMDAYFLKDVQVYH